MVNGIDGTGTVRNNFADNIEGGTTLVFTNTSDASFKGVLMDDWSSDSKLAKITVIMDGAEKCHPDYPPSFHIAKQCLE